MDWKKTIGNIAPTIGAVFGAPGIAVGTAIRSILNMSDTSSDEEVKAVLATPEGQEKVRLAEIAYKGQLLEAGIKEQEIAASDRNSARDMQKAALAPGQTDVFSKRFVYYFSIYWSIISALYIAFITFAHIPPENVRFADTILGFILGTSIASMFQYFLGSTSSSKSKDEIIQHMVKK